MMSRKFAEEFIMIPAQGISITDVIIIIVITRPAVTTMLLGDITIDIINDMTIDWK
jgi:hypothetical protein